MPTRLRYIKPTASPIEILGIIGFGLLLSVFFQVENWLLFLHPILPLLGPNFEIQEHLLLQLIVLLGMLLSYIVIKRTVQGSALSKDLSLPLRWLNAVGMVLILLLGFLDVNLVAIPYLIWAVCALIFGFTLSFYIINWLDVCTRAKIYNILFFVSAAFLTGAVIVFINILLPSFYQAGFTGVCFVLSLFLLNYINARTHEVSSTLKNSDFLNYRKSISIQYFIIAATLGVAVALIWAQGSGSSSNISGELLVLAASVAVVVGAGISLVLSFWMRQFNIVPVLRIFTFVALFLAIVDYFVKLPVLSELILTLAVLVWIVLTILNFSGIVNKCRAKNLSVFSHAPYGLTMRLAGFAFGWLLVLGSLSYLENISDLRALLLIFGIAAVTVNLLVYPNSTQHHAVDLANFPASSNVDAIGIDKSKLSKSKDTGLNTEAADFDKVLALAQMYTLSVREIDVLRYLYKGRNASYCAKTLSISPHTAKSHIYRIYNKLNIHSQQELIDTIDTFDLSSRRPG